MSAVVSGGNQDCVIKCTAYGSEHTRRMLIRPGAFDRGNRYCDEQKVVGTFLTYFFNGDLPPKTSSLGKDLNQFTCSFFPSLQA